MPRTHAELGYLIAIDGLLIDAILSILLIVGGILLVVLDWIYS